MTPPLPTASTGTDKDAGHTSEPPSQAATAPVTTTSNPMSSLARPLPLRSSTFSSTDDVLPRRASRKLQKKHHKGIHGPAMELPDRLKDRGDDTDKEEDVRPGAYGGGFMTMNQSVFGLIAAAGSTVDFGNRFEGQSSDEDEDGDGAHSRDDGGAKKTSQTTILPQPSRAGTQSSSKSHRRKFSESRLLKSVPGLKRLSTRVRSKTGKHKDEPHDDDPISPILENTTLGPTVAPVMSRMLEARKAARPSVDLDRLEHEAGEGGPSLLTQRLMEIFDFDKPEEVIEEYPCWLLQHVLLQGYMYITSRHVAFYAYLPKKANEIAKTGYLSKSGKRNPRYSRFWFTLKGDVLSYFNDPNRPYFPHGQIDLRYGISANISEKDKEGLHFTVATHHRTYYFKADSAPSAQEWVKSLQRVIFRSHNDGDSIKISLPIENIIDIEEVQMLDFADTCKIRVFDNNETYAIDEYFFSFFQKGSEVLNILSILTEDAAARTPGAHGLPSSRGSVERSDSSDLVAKRGKKTADLGSSQILPKIRTKDLKITESVRATLSPLSPGVNATSSPRPSGEMSRNSFDIRHLGHHRNMEHSHLGTTRRESPRRSYSGSRRSLSTHRLTEKSMTPKQESSDSYVQSLEDPSLASTSGVMASISDDASASQILRGSDVFNGPTIHKSASASKLREKDGMSVAPPVSHTPPSSKLAPRHAVTTGHLKDAEFDESGAPAPTLQSIARMGGYPLQKAGAIMGYLDQHTKRMSNLLAAESMSYVEKVSGMWKGEKKHYDEPAGLRTDDEDNEDSPEDRIATGNRFRSHFALPDTETLRHTFFCYLSRGLPLYGKIYISDRHFCFRSLILGTRAKVILPLRDIETVEKGKGFRIKWEGLTVVIRGHEELFFEFPNVGDRNDCAVTLLQSIEKTRYLREPNPADCVEEEDAEAAVAERDALEKARLEQFPEKEVEMPHQVNEAPTILFDDPKASFLNFKPAEPMRITCLTIGSRGDVQPYIALCKGLLADGHKPRIATHGEFKDWIESHGIEFRHLDGDPGELMQLCIQNGTFTWAFLKEANSKFRGWLDELLASAWTACQDSDLLIESPSAMAGIHIAEALQIPYFRAFTMPWSRTRAYPHAFVTPGQKMGGGYNYMTYVMFDTVFWKATASQVNRWRNKSLGLPNTTLEKMQPNKVPFLYNFSPFVVPPPLDYSDWIRVTGYWFLDEGGDKWQPPKDLVEFIEKARADEKKIVYVGFGSIIVPDPAKMTQDVIDAVLRADVRCILSKGWSDRMETKAVPSDPGATATKVAANDPNSKPEPVLPPEIFQIKSAPHDWLFKQIDAAAHHGGSGTTGASLRAGIPTIIRPFFGDQFFFGSRVEDLGIGICLKKWGANSFARALWEATNSERMISKARVLGEEIRGENGVATAIQCIYRDLEYARSLAKTKARKNPNIAVAPQHQDTAYTFDDPAEEESWTFVGADTDGGEDMLREASEKSHPVDAGSTKSQASGEKQKRSIQLSRGRSLGSKVMKSTMG